MNDPTPAKVRTLDIEGQPVRCIEELGGKRLWLCDCPKFTAVPRGTRKDSAVTPPWRSGVRSATARSVWTPNRRLLHRHFRNDSEHCSPDRLIDFGRHGFRVLLSLLKRLQAVEALDGLMLHFIEIRMARGECSVCELGPGQRRFPMTAHVSKDALSIRVGRRLKGGVGRRATQVVFVQARVLRVAL